MTNFQIWHHAATIQSVLKRPLCGSQVLLSCCVAAKCCSRVVCQFDKAVLRHRGDSSVGWRTRSRHRPTAPHCPAKMVRNYCESTRLGVTHTEHFSVLVNTNMFKNHMAFFSYGATSSVVLTLLLVANDLVWLWVLLLLLSFIVCWGFWGFF